MNDKSITSGRGKWSIVCIVSFPAKFHYNSLLSACYRLVGYVAKSLQRVRKKLASSPSTRKLQGNMCNGLWALAVGTGSFATCTLGFSVFFYVYCDCHCQFTLTFTCTY